MKTHISLNVTDIDRSVDFYRRMFGVEPLKVKVDYAKFDVADPSLNLALNRADHGKGGALSHLGIQVSSTDEVLDVGAGWKERGLETLEEMETDCCYALQDKIWVADPDGNNWEIFVVHSDTEGGNLKPATCCETDSETVSIGQSGAALCC